MGAGVFAEWDVNAVLPEDNVFLAGEILFGAGYALVVESSYA